MNVAVPSYNSAAVFYPDDTGDVGSLPMLFGSQVLVTFDYSAIIGSSSVGVIQSFELNIQTNPQLIISKANISGAAKNLVSFVVSAGIAGLTYDLTTNVVFSNATARSDVLHIVVAPPATDNCCAPVGVQGGYQQAELISGGVYGTTLLRYYVSKLAPTGPNVSDRWYNAGNGDILDYVTDGSSSWWQPAVSSSGIADAPSDGNLYGRKNLTWAVVPPPGIADAPSTNQYFARYNGAWVISPIGITDAPNDGQYYSRRSQAWSVTPGGLADAPNDGKLYGRESAAWVTVPPPGIADAPNDGNPYARQNNSWVVVSVGGGTNYLPLSGGVLTGPLTVDGTFTAAGTATFESAATIPAITGPTSLTGNLSVGGNLSSGPIAAPSMTVPVLNGNLSLNGNVTSTGNAAFNNATFTGDVTAAKVTSTITSDARIKEVLDEYRPGLEEISQLRPVAFRYKGNEASTAQGVSPHNDDARDRKVHIGLVAQEVEELFPGMVSHHKAFIDGREVDDLRKLDTHELIYALVNSVKTLKNELHQLRDELSEERLRRT